MKVLYLDVFFFINFLVDFLLLVMTALLSNQAISRFRMTVSAIVGGVYALVAVLLPVSIGGAWYVQILIGWLLCIIAFGYTGLKQSLRLFLTYFIASISCAGFVCLVSFLTNHFISFSITDAVETIGAKTIVFSSLAVYLLLSVLLKGRTGNTQIVDTTIHACGKEVHVRTLIDTGNNLRDPLTNTAVLIVWKKQVYALFDTWISEVLEQGNLEDAVDVFTKLTIPNPTKSFHLIPYRSVGTKAGMLLSFTADSMEMNGIKAKSKNIALSEHPLSDGRTFDAIIGT